MQSTFSTRLLSALQRWLGRDDLLVPALITCLLWLASFQISLWFLPTLRDDVAFWNAASLLKSPLAYFQGYPIEGALYRPLSHTLTWITLRIFGFHPSLEQFLGIALHLFNSLLLLRIIGRWVRNPISCFLITCLFLISLCTYWSSTMVNDREAVLVGSCLLLLLDRILVPGRRAKEINFYFALFLSVAGILFKESGLLIPGVYVVFCMLDRKTPVKFRLKVLVSCSALVIAYLALRFRLYPSGHIYDSHYSTISGMGLPERYRHTPVGMLFNVFKLVVAPSILPVFDEVGKLYLHPFMLLCLTIPTMGLCLLAFQKRLTHVQLLGLAIIVLNAFIHYATFEVRYLYLAAIGFCLLIAGSSVLVNSPKKIQMANILMTIILVHNTYGVGSALLGKYMGRYEELHVNHLKTMMNWHQTPYDPKFMDSLLKKYLTPN